MDNQFWGQRDCGRLQIGVTIECHQYLTKSLEYQRDYLGYLLSQPPFEQNMLVVKMGMVLSHAKMEE